jgi:hypothetical protein
MAGARVHDVESNPKNGWPRSVLTELSETGSTSRPSLAPEPSDDMSTKIKDLIFSESTLTDQQTIKLYQNLDDDRLSDVFSTGVAIDWCPAKLVATWPRKSRPQSSSSFLAMITLPGSATPNR